MSNNVTPIFSAIKDPVVNHEISPLLKEALANKTDYWPIDAASNVRLFMNIVPDHEHGLEMIQSDIVNFLGTPAHPTAIRFAKGAEGKSCVLGISSGPDAAHHLEFSQDDLYAQFTQRWQIHHIQAGDICLNAKPAPNN